LTWLRRLGQIFFLICILLVSKTVADGSGMKDEEGHGQERQSKTLPRSLMGPSLLDTVGPRTVQHDYVTEGWPGKPTGIESDELDK
jgi:hypothetical protein